MNKLLNTIVTVLDSKKANDITVIDFRNENPLCDSFVVCDAGSFRQINALADDVIEELAKNDFPVRSVERQEGSSWILIDAIDVVIHIFLSDDRHHYNLEKLYKDYIDEIVL
ncbi:ribosome silencing factor [Erysipelothrix urinaevulpis]|uniref:ribosome silencing factor n=1 Tax=Erysipelothrix urinaevulpis TaxID=2683717 RepID=UPI00135962B2|nr:ribosome silencing factor [Erysipelothrix urinaevulpis]